MIKEVIVVEGKDDMSAVKKACQAEIIITNGLGINKKTLAQIKNAQKRCGVIILTDPDFAGEKIRTIIEQAVPGCRHAFLENQNKQKRGKIGVEYASPEEIKSCLARAHASYTTKEPEYSFVDMYKYRLMGQPKSSLLRNEVAKILALGQPNGKQLLNRLNAYGISRPELMQAIATMEEQKSE